MRPFSYLEPEGLPAAIALLAEHGEHAKVLAGGQSLNLALKDRSARPRFLISLAHIRELRGVQYTGHGQLEIGAATTYAAVGAASLRGWHSEISSVCLGLADRSVRNLGTLGGAVCQSDPRFDIPTLLVGLDATLITASPAGSRNIPAAEFFAPNGGTCLGPSEILTTLRFPAISSFTAVAFEKFRYRVFDAAIVNILCAIRQGAQGLVETARIAVGAVHKAPVLAMQAAGFISNQPLTTRVIEVAAQRAADEILPESAVKTRLHAYQRELITTLIKLAFAGITAKLQREA
jgi:aerobic carbon-monoxide dehydrogenase medium subunit